jgi:hypothetical protein
MEKLKFKKGDLVTVSNAHPLHKEWYGLVLDGRSGPKKGALFSQKWLRLLQKDCPPLLENRNYYLVFGPSFGFPEKLDYYLFVDSNLIIAHGKAISKGEEK